MIHTGDCLDVMAGMEPESVDAIVTDPPYDLTDSGSMRLGPHPGGSASRNQTRGFMGKAWDGTGIAFDVATWAAAYRVAKPSAYLLAFGGTRTVHRMTVALEDAGWIIRDMLVWAYASGFPKSKASLKPAWEPIVMARKPGPLRELAIDACRIGYASDADLAATQGQNPGKAGATVTSGIYGPDRPQQLVNVAGRWPANVILTDPIFDGGIEGVVGGGIATTHPGQYRDASEGNWFGPERAAGFIASGGDSGTYSRFFLIPKADRAEREPVVRGQVGTVTRAILGQGIGGADNLGVAHENVHPTVKPVDLMRHLVRLVTPTGGTVLDPFLGSGTTGIACELEGFPWIGIEREAEYVAIAEARLNGTQRGMGLESA